MVFLCSLFAIFAFAVEILQPNDKLPITSKSSNMKKFLVTLFSVVAASVSSGVFAGTPITQSELPKAAQTFISKYFPDDKVWEAEKDRGSHGIEYDVDMESGAELEFMSDGTWKGLKSARGKSIPSAVIPAAIVKYVNANFQSQSIVEISRKRGGYKVELSNGSELMLTEDAKPMPARK